MPPRMQRRLGTMLEQDTMLRLAEAFRNRFGGDDDLAALLDVRDITTTNSSKRNRPCVFISAFTANSFARAKEAAAKAAAAAQWALARPLNTGTGSWATVLVDRPEELSPLPEYIIGEAAPGTYAAWINVCSCAIEKTYNRAYRAAADAAAEWNRAAQAGTWELVKLRQNSSAPRLSYDLDKLRRSELQKSIDGLLRQKGIR